jgi:hypothetical protein
LLDIEYPLYTGLGLILSMFRAASSIDVSSRKAASIILDESHVVNEFVAAAIDCW